MNEFIIKENLSSDIENELEKIGFDKGYKYVAANKFKYKNLNGTRTRSLFLLSVIR